jgi:hypothetical protein
MPSNDLVFWPPESNETDGPNPTASGRNRSATGLDWKDVVLYALGVGAGFDDLDYCYETRLKVVPSFSIGAVFDFLAQVGLSSNADLAGILHGEQDIIFHNPIPTEGRLSTEGAITHIFDKGADKGALVVAEAETYHSNGQKLFTNIFTLFCRRDGGFGGPDAPKDPVEPIKSDFEEEEPSPDQPFCIVRDIFAYGTRICLTSGFEKPIMTICTHGHACRAVIKNLFPVSRTLAIRIVFSHDSRAPHQDPDMKVDEGRLFRTISSQTGEVVIDRGIEMADPGRNGRARGGRHSI